MFKKHTFDLSRRWHDFRSCRLYCFQQLVDRDKAYKVIIDTDFLMAFAVNLLGFANTDSVDQLAGCIGRQMIQFIVAPDRPDIALKVFCLRTLRFDLLLQGSKAMISDAFSSIVVKERSLLACPSKIGRMTWYSFWRCSAASR